MTAYMRSSPGCVADGSASVVGPARGVSDGGRVDAVGGGPREGRPGEVDRPGIDVACPKRELATAAVSH